MSLADELAAQAAQSVRAERPTHPQGWDPGSVWNGQTGTITSRPLAEPTPNWDELLRVWGFDPANVEVVEPVQVRTWDAAIGNGETRTMWYYRAGIRARRADAPDIEDLIAEVRRHKPRRPSARNEKTTNAPGAFVYCAADWQIGKLGTKDFTEARILRSFDDAAERYRELRKIGRQFDTIYMLGLGDLVEGCQGHYDMQPYEVELDQRSQDRLARELWIAGVKTLAPLAPRVVCAAIGGNHGENRKDGKAFTTFADNRDVSVVENAARALAENPATYGHVSFLLPEEQLTLTLDMAGLIVGIAHGHQARRSGTKRPPDSSPRQGAVREWWKDQAFGRRPVGDADLLITGHYHHFGQLFDGGRAHFQAPTMDAGSQWWEETAGMPTVPGALTFAVQHGRWQDVQLL